MEFSATPDGVGEPFHGYTARADVYTIEELARRGPFGRTTLLKFMAEGALVARKAGRRTVILPDDWRLFLSSLPARAPRSAAA